MADEDGAKGRWFHETLYDSVRIGFEADRVLHEESTEHFSLALIENARFGKVLMLDGITQVTTEDEFIYHEMVSHVPIYAHGSAREVLIIGGGDCGMAEEVLKHGSIERLTQVEIDRSVVDFSKEHFASFNAPVFEDARFNLVIDDGAGFVAGTEDRFDVVIVETVGVGQSETIRPIRSAPARCCSRPGSTPICTGCWRRAASPSPRTACRSSSATNWSARCAICRGRSDM